jgi:hypothetical protein
MRDYRKQVKKRTKKLLDPVPDGGQGRSQTDKSFLLLFFKKEALSSPQSTRLATSPSDPSETQAPHYAWQ